MKNSDATKITPRRVPATYCIRLSRAQRKRLAGMGRLERRRLPRVVRMCLDSAMNGWDATRPTAKA